MNKAAQTGLLKGRTMKAILTKYKVSQGRNGSTVAYYTATDLVRGTLCGVGEVWVWAEGFNHTNGNRIRV